MYALRALSEDKVRYFKVLTFIVKFKVPYHSEIANRLICYDFIKSIIIQSIAIFILLYLIRLPVLII